MSVKNQNLAVALCLSSLFYLASCATARTHPDTTPDPVLQQNPQDKEAGAIIEEDLAVAVAPVKPANPVTAQAPTSEPERASEPSPPENTNIQTPIPKTAVTPPIVATSPKPDSEQSRPGQVEVKTKTENPNSEPVDISDQYTEIVAGIPIIENPKNCGQGNLEIGVVVKNIPKTRGTIVADLHDDVRENFLVWDKVVLRVRVPAHKGEVSFCMPITRPGEYAIAVYHDKNDNKKFDKNFLGIPKERFGMSSNPRFGTRAPKYEEAVFSVPKTGTNIQIKLRKASDILGRHD